MGRISGRPWGIPVAAYGENLMATHIRDLCGDSVGTRAYGLTDAG